jgi:hypothetical protein
MNFARRRSKPENPKKCHFGGIFHPKPFLHSHCFRSTEMLPGDGLIDLHVLLHCFPGCRLSTSKENHHVTGHKRPAKRGA